MACERYREELLGAAAGWLHPEREMRFDAHRRACAACREEFERQQRLFAALEEGLHARVNDELPAGFAARVRARVNEQAVLGVRGVAWLARWVPAWGAIAAVAALAVALCVVYLRRGVRPQNNPPNQIATKAPPSETPTREAIPPRAPAVRTAHNQVQPRPPHLTEKSELPEVLLPSGQREAMARLVEALRTGEVPADTLLAENREVRSLVIAPLAIPPLETKPLDDARQAPGVEPAQNQD